MAGKNGGGTGSRVSGQRMYGRNGSRIGIVYLHAISINVFVCVSKQAKCLGKQSWSENGG